MQTSAQLLPKAIEGDEEAWSNLFRQYNPLLGHIAVGFRLSPEQAADAAQNTWMSLVQNLGRVREPDKLQGWLSVTMRRECIREANSRKRELLRGDWDAEDLGVEEDALTRVRREEEEEALRRAVECLPDRQRVLILVLSETPRPSYHEVARRLSMPVGSIGPIRARALRHLQHLLAEPGDGTNGVVHV
jgi:RNA polymerase sigma factor (sigma-70 family)